MRSRVSLFLAGVLALTTACREDATSPSPSGDTITLSSAQLSLLRDRAEALADANPGIGSFTSLVDSTLLALQAGIQLQQLPVTTDLTTAPLYFVGLHRVIHQSNGGSFSTWTLVGFESPSTFAHIVQTSGFAQSATSTAPTSQSGTIGDGSGMVNGLLLQVSGDRVDAFDFTSGTASFSSSAPSGSCPNGTPAPHTECSLETMTIRFSVSGRQSPSGPTRRSASVATEVTVPAMRLTYTPQ